MTQPLINRPHTNEIYVSALQTAWDQYLEVYGISYALHEDVDAWEICLKNGAFYQGAQQRLHEVIGDEWHCYPANNSIDEPDVKAASITEDALRAIRSFADALKRQAQAVFRGWTAQAIVGRRRWCRLGGVWGNWWVPTGIEHVDLRRFKVIPKKYKDKFGRDRVKGELYIATIPRSAAQQTQRLTHDNYHRYGYARVEHPEHFVITVYDNEESRLSRGRGIMDTLYFYVWADQIIMREGMQALERWAQGIPVGYVDANAPGDTGQDTEAERAAMETSLLRMRGRGVFVTDAKNKVEILGLTGQGHQIVSGWRDYIDSKIIGVATGAILASGTGADTGSFARDKEGSNVQSRVVQFDRNKISEDITAGVVELFWKLNRPQLFNIGLNDAARPEFKLIARREYDANEAVNRVKTARDAGIDLPEDEVYEQIGFSQPKPGQRVLKGHEAPQPQPGGLPFGGGLPGMPGTNPFGQPPQNQPQPQPPAPKPTLPKPAVPVPPPQPAPAMPARPVPTEDDMAGAKGATDLRGRIAVVHEALSNARGYFETGDIPQAARQVDNAESFWERIRRQVPKEAAVSVESAFIDLQKSVEKGGAGSRKLADSAMVAVRKAFQSAGDSGLKAPGTPEEKLSARASGDYMSDVIALARRSTDLAAEIARMRGDESRKAVESIRAEIDRHGEMLAGSLGKIKSEKATAAEDVTKKITGDLSKKIRKHRKAKKA